MADVSLRIVSTDASSETFKKIGAEAAATGTKLEDAGKKGKKAGEDNEKSWVKTLAVWAAVTVAANKLYGAVSAGLKAAADDEKSITQLSAALTQLGYNAGELTPILNAQAAAFEGQGLASDESIRSIQQLLIRYGVAPAAIQATTKAVLDYAAATGTDAESATTTLLRAVEAGGKGLGRMGIDIKETGDKTTDLSAGVVKLQERFGGAAEAASSGLAGQLAKLKIAQENLTEAFGQFLVKTGASNFVLTQLQQAFTFWTEAVTGEGDEAMAAFSARTEEATLATNKLISIRQRLEARERELHEMEATHNPIQIERAQRRVAEVQAEVDAQQRLILALKERNQAEGKKEAGITDTGKSETAFAMEADARARNREKLQEAEDKAWKEWHDNLQEELSMMAEQDMEIIDVAAKEAEEAFKESLQQLQDDVSSMAELDMEAIDKAAAQAKEMGEAIGGALAAGIDRQLAKISAGGEFDIGQLIWDVLATALTALLAYYGVPLPIANLAGTAIKSIGGAMTGGGGNKKKYHDGGPVDGLPRFHDGGSTDEVPAVLQRGEYVVSRADVQASGGMNAVESMVKGSGGAMNVYITAIDAKSFEDFIAGDGGSAIVRAINGNRGELPTRLRRLSGKGG